MRRPLLIALASCALAGAAGAMTKADYQAQRLRIQHQYATAKDRCSAATGHARELCRTQAHVEYDTARAQLRAQYKPSPRNRQQAGKAQADGAYQLAREKCGDLSGGARDVCRSEAKAAWQSARAGNTVTKP